MDNQLYVVMYHYVRELRKSRYPEIKGLDYELFKNQVEFLANNFNIVSMEEVIEAYNGSYTLPEKAMLLTFDDGYIDHFNYVFPILNLYKIQGSFFVPGKVFVENKLLDVNKIHFILASAKIEKLVQALYKQLDYYRGQEYQIMSNEELFNTYTGESRFDSKEIIFFKRVLQKGLSEDLRNKITSTLFKEYVGIDEEKFARELYMNYDQMRCMKNSGMHFGLHGYDHYWLNKLTEEELVKDIDKALECMGELIDSKNWVMNYPYGSYSEDVIKYIDSQNCKLGLSTNVGIAMVGKDNKFKIPRFDTNDFPPKSSNYISVPLKS